MKKIYNKLVRDLIPTIIEKNGDTCTTKILDDKEYLDELNKKLLEDVDGYIRIPKEKLYLSNSILVNFIGGSNE